MEEAKEPKTFERLCVLALDGSGSMEEINPASSVSKALTINQCVKDLILRLQEDRYSSDFLITILTFDDTTDRNPVLPITPIEDIDINNYDFDPMNMNGVIRGGQTAIGDALEAAFNVAYDFVKDPNHQYPRSAVILLMTDGKNNAGKDPKKVSHDIQGRIRREELGNMIRRICVLGFGDPNDRDSLDVDLLKSIATEPTEGAKPNYKQTLEPEEIVDFFIRSLTK